MKKFLAGFLFPLQFTVILALVGAFLFLNPRSTPKRKKLGLVILATTCCLFLIYSTCGWIPSRYLERCCPVLHVTEDLAKQGPFVICVAGCSYLNDTSLPDNYHYPPYFLERMMEGARIAHELEKFGADYKLVASVQIPRQDYKEISREDRLKSAQDFCAMLGIPKEKVELLPDPCYNTKMELREFIKFPGKYILVSSAAHVPRIMRIAHKLQMDAIPSPGGLHFGSKIYLRDFWPSASNLEFLRCAAYEFYGTLQYELHF